MSKTASRMKLAGLAATVALLGAGCMAGRAATPSASSTTPAPTPSPIASGRTTATPTPSPSGSDPAVAGPRLIVLADGVDGGLGLWAVDMEGHWTILGATPGANALGRTTGGVAVATGHRIDIRPDSDLTHSGTNTELKWPRTEPNAPVTALDGSVTGKFAFVTSDAKSLDYGLANSTGSVTALAPAPTQSFTPLVAWLDEARVLTLSTDNQQASRLAIVDSSARSIDSLQALAGVRWFGLSSDRHTIAAATESAIYVGTVAAFQAQALPPKAVTLDDLRIAWALALDAGGSMIFMLSGTEAADGTVGAIREVGYSKQGSTWTRVLDSPAPFGRAIAQVYLPA